MLRPLLKKDIAWTWTVDHEKSFKEVKTLLTSKTIIHPFDQDAETFLLTDASRLHGLGFALMQRNGGEHFLIQCGSCSLTPTQQRYATVELECMAIQWAIKKSEFYLRGLPNFDVLTNHRPLVGVFRKQLSLLENARLMRMREKSKNSHSRLNGCKVKHTILLTHYLEPLYSHPKKKNSPLTAQIHIADK